MAIKNMPTQDEYLRSVGDKGRRGRYPVARPIKEPDQKRPGRWKRVLKWTFLAILVLIIGVVIYVAQFLTKLSVNPLDLSGLQADSSGRTNILILGIGDPGHAGEKLSDTNLVMSIDNSTKQVAMISVPRDLRVQVPGYGYNKINTANSLGGPKLAEQTVSDTLGIPINYYVVSDFSGLSQAVDAVGGLDVTVTQALVDAEYPCADNQYQVCGLNIQPGQYHMNGAMALEYVRCRKGTCGNDFGRAARQQEILKKLQEKVFTSQVYMNPARLTALSAAVSSNITTDLSVHQLLQVGFKLRDAKHPINFVLSTSPGGYLRGDPGGSSDLLPIGGSFDQIQAYVQGIFGTSPAK